MIEKEKQEEEKYNNNIKFMQNKIKNLKITNSNSESN
jgi:hypothetical protein